MPRHCSACDHDDREDIDAALVAGESYRAIARRFGLSRDAVGRHKAKHLPAAMLAGRDAADTAHGDDLLAQCRDLQTKALGILAKAEKSGDLRTAIAANREARGCLELLARLLAELPGGAAVDLFASQDWTQALAVLLAALEPFPDARLAVADRLAELDP
jgi:hypothetical protein